MSGFSHLNLIHFFDFYLMLMLILSTFAPAAQSWDSAGLVLKGPGRWPRLFKLVKQHRTVFMTWATILPLILALTLMVIQWLASRLVWPHAQLYGGTLLQHPGATAVVPLVGAAMLGLDVYGIIRVGEVDRGLLEQYFDQAEYWLRSHAAHVVRIVTFGFINPRQMVDTEVRKNLTQASQLLNSSLWWVSVQLGLRVAFGLAIWLTWALTRSV